MANKLAFHLENVGSTGIVGGASCIMVERNKDVYSEICRTTGAGVGEGIKSSLFMECTTS